MEDIKVGDSILFHAICRWPTRYIWRTVNGRVSDGSLTVSAYGSSNFVVNDSEIKEVRRGGSNHADCRRCT